MPNRFAVPGDDDVPLKDARRGARASRVDADYHGARFVAALDGNRLEAEANITPSNATKALQLRRHAFDRGRGNDEDTLTRPKNRHTDGLTVGIEGEAPLGGPP